MPLRNAAFEAYLGEASQGRNSVWRLFVAITVIVVSYAIPIALAVLATAGTGKFAFEDVESRIGIALVLLSVIWLLPATWLAIRLAHRRRPAGTLGVGGSISWRHLGRAFAVTAVVLVATTLVGLVFDPRIDRGPTSPGMWVAAAPLFAILILLQTAAEEVFFRGYLVQLLALRFRSPLVWAGIPTALFTMLHWNGDVSVAMNLSALATIAAFAFAATALLVRTGNLGAAIGFHFANNVVAMLFFSSSNAFNATALFVLPPIESPEWNVADAVLFAAVQITAIVVVTALLLHARSPFRIVADRAKKEVREDPEPVASDR